VAGDHPMIPDDERKQLIALNEAVYRKLNEAIERGRWPGEDEQRAFRCECARRGCAQMLQLSHGEYERLRAHPRRFAIAMGHEDPQVEDVIESHLPRYLIVEKRGQAGRLAEETDPRS
jgi:hypothetical protein